MKPLIIAEKPSVARAIATALGGGSNRNGYIESNNFIITWCIGHLIGLADADQYNPAMKKWSLETLPFFPETWKLVPTKLDYAQKQLKVLEGLIKKASEIIHCGDPDREGQLLVEELFYYFGVKEKLNGRIRRALVTDLSPEGIRKAFNNLKDNDNYHHLYLSALARQRSDWLLGINLSRAVTLWAQKAGYSGAISIGRVFTPLLAMIYNRDKEIENFVPHDYYQIFIQADVLNNDSYKVYFDGKESPNKTIVCKLDLLQTMEAMHPEVYSGKKKATIEDLLNDEVLGRVVDDSGKMINVKFLEFIKNNIVEEQGYVTKFDSKETKEASPLGYALSDLQQAAFNIFSIPVDSTLSIVQELYEQGYVTYPRTDCGYLNEADYEDRFKICTNLAQLRDYIPGLERIDGQFNINQKTRIWNSSKVENHSAIIPTVKACNWDKLSDLQQKIYQLIAKRYLVQFLPPAKYQSINLSMSFELLNKPWIFSANSKSLLDPGWKALTMSQKQFEALEKGEIDENGNSLLSEEEQEQAMNRRLSLYLSKQAITGLVIGDLVECVNVAHEVSQTTPPQHFNDATLLSAMTYISRYVKDPELKKILNETDGLGTEATRATIIAKLYAYNYCEKKKKYIVTTQIGRGLIESLPEELTLPDTTALWEKMLSSIAKGNYSDAKFTNSIEQGIAKILNTLENNGEQGFRALNGLGQKKEFSSSGYKKSSSGRKYSKSSSDSYSKSNYSKGSYSKTGAKGKGSYSKGTSSPKGKGKVFTQGEPF